MVKQPLNKQVKQRYPTDEDVAMRCSAQSDHAGSAADPEWEAVLAQQIAEEAEEEELCRRFEHGSDDGWEARRRRRMAMLLCRAWLGR